MRESMMKGMVIFSTGIVLGVLVSMGFVLLLLLRLRHSEGLEVEHHNYRLSTFNENEGTTTRGVISMPEILEENQFLSYEDESGKHLISNFGDDEYRCSAFCHCHDHSEPSVLIASDVYVSSKEEENAKKQGEILIKKFCEKKVVCTEGKKVQMMVKDLVCKVEEEDSPKLFCQGKCDKNPGYGGDASLFKGSVVDKCRKMKFTSFLPLGMLSKEEREEEEMHRFDKFCQDGSEFGTLNEFSEDEGIERSASSMCSSTDELQCYEL